MRNLKKFLALALAMVMAFSLMLTANAKDVVKDWNDSDAVTPAFSEAVDVLSGMKVYQGDDRGDFNPDKPITRAEVAALIYRLATGDVDNVRAGLYANYGNFPDVKESDWFAGYVGYCANAGYIKGRDNGNFDPYASVTGYETLAMVLRAAGYDKNNEFTGAAWQTNVSAMSTQLGILTDVKTTHYGNTLHLASRRDVVASLLFNTATKVNMVTWTQLTGYNKYTTPLGLEQDDDGKAILNPTLGYLHFGLTSAERIILGNQATGEGCTLLGNDTVEYTSTAATGAKKVNLDVSYVYPGSVIKLANATDVEPETAAAIAVGDGIKLAGKTGLDMFGHKVKAWYDDRDAGNKTTYAILDKATLTATVQSLTANKQADDPNLSGSTKGLGIQAQKAGFTVDLDNSKAWISDRYNRITSDGAGTKPAAGKVKSAAAADSDDYGIFALISNNDDKTVDVIISLAGEVGIIAQKNTTATVQTLTVADTTAQLTNKSTFTGASATAGILAINSLTEASTQTLGDKVVAWQVIGTNNADTYDTWVEETGNAGTYKNGNTQSTNYYRYDLEKLEKTTTITVRSYGTNSNEITTTDGTVYKPSWFRTKPVASVDQSKDNVIGATNSAEPFKIPTTFEVGKTYTLALDNFGNWLGLTAARDEFLYITYADYEVGGLGDGSIKYAVTGVNWDGEKVVNHSMTSLVLADNSAKTTDADSDPDVFPTAGDPERTLALGYNHNTNFNVNKKFLGAVTDDTGNQQRDGKYTGSVVSTDGNVDMVNLGGYAKLASDDWTIDATDVKNGFADLADDGKTLATPNTKFIVVSGTGTATLNVEVYNGMSEFLKGSSWVSINNSSSPKGNTYYLTEADRYNKWNTDNVDGTNKNDQVSAVILDKRDVTWSSKSDLYYAAPGAVATGAKLAGTDPNKVEQYELWHNGVKDYYFVNIDNGSGGDVDAGKFSPTAGDPAVGQATKGDFYTLIQIDTVNGMPIYKAVKAAKDPAAANYDVADLDDLAGNGVCNIDRAYAYIGTSNINTASIGGEIYNVTNAKVVDLVWDSTKPYTEIKSVADINAAISGGYTGIKVAIVNDGVNVSVIYVTTVA